MGQFSVGGLQRQDWIDLIELQLTAARLTLSALLLAFNFYAIIISSCVILRWAEASKVDLEVGSKIHYKLS